MVKSELCNFERILLVVLDFSDSPAAAIAMDHQRIYNRNKDSTVMQLHSNRLMVSTCCFHDHPGVFTKGKNLIGQPFQADRIVRDIDRCLHNFTHGPENSHRALAFRHIDTNSVHSKYLLIDKNSWRPLLLIACSISWSITRTHRKTVGQPA